MGETVAASGETSGPQPSAALHLEHFKGRHKGERCAVLGGGASLIRDMNAIPADARLIGINQHTAILPLDYIVFSDPHIADAVKDVDCVKFTHYAKLWGGRIAGCAFAPNFGLTGPLGVWIAGYMDFARIQVAGMDGYLGEKRYWYQLEREPVRGRQINYWQECRKCFPCDPRRVSFLDRLLQQEWDGTR